MFEIRYSKPPHAVGFDRVRCEDEFDAQILGEQRYGDEFISAYEIERGDFSRSESHDRLLLAAGPTPGWLRKIGVAVDAALDGAIRRR